MKRTISSCVALLAASLPSLGQLVLNAGDTYSYEFGTLPFNRRIVGEPAANYGYFYFTFGAATFTTGDMIRLQFFENSLTESPIRTMDFTPSDGPTFGIYVGQGWQDIQGAFRITQLSGSETIDSINVQVVKSNGDSTFNFYQQIFTPVPEPSAITLFAIAGTTLLGWRWWKRYYCYWPRRLTIKSLQRTVAMRCDL